MMKPIDLSALDAAAARTNAVLMLITLGLALVYLVVPATIQPAIQAPVTIEVPHAVQAQPVPQTAAELFKDMADHD